MEILDFHFGRILGKRRGNTGMLPNDMWSFPGVN